MSEIADGQTTDILDPEQIDMLLSLDDGAGAVLTEIVEEFFTTSDPLRASLLCAIGEADCEATQRAAHTLKGASANVGASGLSVVCSQLEAQALGGTLDETMRPTEQFEVEYERACDALRALTGGS